MTMKLGERIKQIRKDRKMTLKDVAGLTGFSISFLSQLERGVSSATLESLKKIAVALRVSPGDFFAEEETSHGNGPDMVERIASYGIHYQNLAKGFPAPDFMPMRVTLKPGENGGKPIMHAGQEFVFVLDGRLTVEADGGLHELASGESLFYDAGKPHYWYNRFGAPVTFLCVSSDT
ncbi:helix-turn-helix domain-containing protein [Edaphobacillus lindanitolerans]|uniref:Transcriptional regulator, XRE family with cupin sensor n=1 Tax=Edaphobacillus lindanitolerans TaxID=550447 RepID=A0A1U7PMF5_9BACI|nr:cupin domain-containing protein [Edaphobacillus lindanitolerans]SIT71577.1 transcriptional regulator, XRE family with cupin sensor [Edaphobacillus lindanitolerans]